MKKETDGTGHFPTQLEGNCDHQVCGERNDTKEQHGA